MVMPLLADERATPLSWPLVQSVVDLLLPWKGAHKPAVPRRRKRVQVSRVAGK